MIVHKADTRIWRLNEYWKCSKINIKCISSFRTCFMCSVVWSKMRLNPLQQAARTSVLLHQMSLVLLLQNTTRGLSKAYVMATRIKACICLVSLPFITLIESERKSFCQNRKVFVTWNVRYLPTRDEMGNYGIFAASSVIYFLFFSREFYKQVLAAKI